MSFAQNLKIYREKAGYSSAKEFANTLGIAYTTYLPYENPSKDKGREPKYETLLKIADALDVTVDELLGAKRSKLKKYTELCSLAGINTKLLPEYSVTVGMVGDNIVGYKEVEKMRKNGISVYFPLYGGCVVLSQDEFIELMDKVYNAYKEQISGILFDKIALAFLPIRKD